MTMEAAQPDEQSPHYHGHRDRLRQRFVQAGVEALADYEVLELILFMAIPRRDVKPLAKLLLARFENVAGVLNATLPELQSVDGVTENIAVALKTVQAASHRLLKQEVLKKPILNSWSRLVEYVTATMAYERKEFFRVLFLNKKNELIADETLGSGTVDHTPAYPREIMKRALKLASTAIILVHNHPSGDPTPSNADVEMTKAIKAAGAPFNIVIHDHLIVSKHGTTSFKTLGLL